MDIWCVNKFPPFCTRQPFWPGAMPSEAKHSVWIGTFPNLVRVRGHGVSNGKSKAHSASHNFNANAWTPWVSRQTQDAGVAVAEFWEGSREILSVGGVVGIAQISFDPEPYHDMMTLHEHELQQYQLWSHLVHSSVGRLVRAHVHDAVLFARAEMLHRLDDLRWRGCTVELEYGQADRLAAALTVLPPWLCRESLPNVCIRLPSPYAVLIAAKCWPSMWLPHVDGGHGRWAIKWHLLEGCAVPQLPDIVYRALALTVDDENWGRMDARTALAAANAIRELVLVSPLQEERWIKAYNLASTLQKYHDEMSSDGLSHHVETIFIQASGE